MLKRLFYIPVVNVIYWLIALQVLDGLLTALGVSIFGVDREGNEFLKGLIIQYGLVILVPAKLIPILFLTLALKYQSHLNLIPVYKVVPFLVFVPYYYVVFQWSLILIHEA